jgi:hypothetical protein
MVPKRYRLHCYRVLHSLDVLKRPATLEEIFAIYERLYPVPVKRFLRRLIPMIRASRFLSVKKKVEMLTREEYLEKTTSSVIGGKIKSPPEVVYLLTRRGLGYKHLSHVS